MAGELCGRDDAGIDLLWFTLAMAEDDLGSRAPFPLALTDADDLAGGMGEERAEVEVLLRVWDEVGPVETSEVAGFLSVSRFFVVVNQSWNSRALSPSITLSSPFLARCLSIRISSIVRKSRLLVLSFVRVAGVAASLWRADWPA